MVGRFLNLSVFILPKQTTRLMLMKPPRWLLQTLKMAKITITKSVSLTVTEIFYYTDWTWYSCWVQITHNVIFKVWPKWLQLISQILVKRGWYAFLHGMVGLWCFSVLCIVDHVPIRIKPFAHWATSLSNGVHFNDLPSSSPNPSSHWLFDHSLHIHVLS